jgi:hypothetical protein
MNNERRFFGRLDRKKQLSFLMMLHVTQEEFEAKAPIEILCS